MFQSMWFLWHFTAPGSALSLFGPPGRSVFPLSALPRDLRLRRPTHFPQTWVHLNGIHMR